jgi:hypothetical protein
LGDYLNSVPGVAIANEILSPVLPCGIPPRRGSKSKALKHVAHWLQALTAPRAGAKFLLEHLMIHDVRPEDLRSRFAGSVFLIIYRSSLLEQYVSFQIGRLTNQWVGRAGSRPFEGKILVEPERFLAFCRKHHERYLAVLESPGLTASARLLRYEDLAAAPQEVFDREVFPLLGLASFPIATSMVKQVTRSMPDVVENYDDLRELIESHGTLDYSLVGA